MSSGILDDFGARPADDAGLAIGPAAQAAGPSDTVLAVDRWGRRRARDIAERWRAAKDMPSEEETVIADAHHALFDPQPQAADRPADTRRAAWWQQLMETPEYRALHAQTCLDPELSELASAAICRQWAEYAAKQPTPDSQGGDGAPQPGAGDVPIEQTLALIRSTAAALREAQEATDEAQALRAGIGAGDSSTIDPETFRAAFARVRSDRMLRAIMRMAGRMRAIAAAQQRTKARHGADEVIGIEPTGDIARLLPQELAMLDCGIEELELMTLARIAERRALGRQMRAVERAAKGPVIVLVDESGSMHGERIVAAKALACALAWVAHHQRRWIALVAFSGDARARAYVAEPRKSDPHALLGWLSDYMGGGTTLDVLADTLPGKLYPAWRAQGLPAGKTDLIVITDDEINAPDERVQRILDWRKAEQVRAYGIAIGTRTAGVLTRICDRTYCVPSLDPDTLAVSDILSI